MKKLIILVILLIATKHVNSQNDITESNFYSPQIYYNLETQDSVCFSEYSAARIWEDISNKEDSIAFLIKESKKEEYLFYRQNYDNLVIELADSNSAFKERFTSYQIKKEIELAELKGKNKVLFWTVIGLGIIEVTRTGVWIYSKVKK